ncbi:hypothetical protein BGX31_005248 [Mortierella sp. GBA43]|nr:hypothetical protein BGX31_005248 [Mortierella sp. GBA43]
MRGRLPETHLADSQSATNADALNTLPNPPSTDNTASLEPSEEESTIHEHILEIEDEIRECLSVPADPIASHILSQRERIALMGIAHLVQHDMRVLQSGLSSAGRPPDQRDGNYTPAPDWDNDYLAALIGEWDEPVVLESDYYLLRSMCLYDIGTSIQVQVLGRDKVKKYMDMAFTLAQKGQQVLRTVLEQDSNAMDKYWRYPTMISYIHQQQANETLEEIKEYEKVVGIPAPDSFLERARQRVSLALRSFYRAMRCHPNISQSMDRPFKDQEWCKMATLTDSYTDLTDEYSARQIWSQHTIKLLKEALHEDRSKASYIQLQISKVQLRFSLWIHEQPEKPLLLFPKVSPMFQEMRRSAIAGKDLDIVDNARTRPAIASNVFGAALVYAKHAILNARDEDMDPSLYCHVINSLYMMSLVCIAPNLIHTYSRKAAYWVEQLRVKFPSHKIDPAYIRSAELMAAKDRVMQAIIKRRQEGVEEAATQ